MKVLMLSGDSSITNPNFPTGKRVEEYRKVFSEIDIVVCHGNVFNFLSGFWRGFALARQKKFDVISAQSPEHWFLAWVLSRLFKIPWQMQVHTDILSPHFVQSSVFNKIRVLLAKFLIPRVNCIRVVSERIKNSLTAYGLRHTAITVLPIFVDVEKIQNSQIKTDLHEKYGHDKFIILMTSRLVREKNIGLAVDALASLIRANRRIQLVIVGNGPEEKKLKLKTQNHGLWTNVVFEPWTDNVVSYYKTCDLFLLTSNYEGYGMTIVEAAFAGVRIISSDVGIAREILEKDAIFETGNISDLKNKLDSALFGTLPKPKIILGVSKEDYLKLFKRSFEICK